MFSRMVPENRCGVCSTTPIRDWMACKLRLRVVRAANPDRSLPGLVEAAEQVDNGGFAAARGTDQGDGFAPARLAG